MEPSSRSEILRYLQGVMQELFQLDAARVCLDARLKEDLELDSIDAIDISVRVEEATGHALEEAQLRTLRTVGDVVDAIAARGARLPS
ncbi:MAG TPA: acyl carrier protein [Kofleriaceae bacterium]|nr:acyl carrier protein [Kofleriaceae bacterium]